MVNSRIQNNLEKELENGVLYMIVYTPIRNGRDDIIRYMQEMSWQLR